MAVLDNLTKVNNTTTGAGAADGDANKHFINLTLPDDGTSWSVGMFAVFTETSTSGVKWIPVSDVTDMSQWLDSVSKDNIGVITEYDGATRAAKIQTHGNYENIAITDTGMWGILVSDGITYAQQPSIDDDLVIVGYSFEVGSIELNLRPGTLSQR